MTELRGITVRQPWAWAIAVGAKTIENRTALTSYRGPLAIHAGREWSARGARDPRIRSLPGAMFVVSGWEGVPLGVIVAVANLVDAHPDSMCCRPWGESSYEEANGGLRTTVVHLVLEDVRALPEPVPCRGMLGLWRPPPDVADEVAVQLVYAEKRLQREA